MKYLKLFTESKEFKYGDEITNADLIKLDSVINNLKYILCDEGFDVRATRISHESNYIWAFPGQFIEF